MLSSDEIKRKAALKAADLVKDGMTIGLGTGSTVFCLIQELAERIASGFRVTAVPTSTQTAGLATAAGIRLTDLDNVDQLVLTIDGADEIDPNGILIKGGGGALLQEKIVASASKELVIIADSSKLSPKLGSFPLPVEVIPFGYKQVIKRILEHTNCEKISLRKKGEQPFMSDHQHFILDCHFNTIQDPTALNNFLHQLPGVVETGLFIGMANRSIIAFENGDVQEYVYNKSI